MITGKYPNAEAAEQTVYSALDLCLACKGCKAECPSAVDMAKLKYEFLNHFYTSHRRKLRDYLFSYIEPIARLAQPFSWLVNPILASPAAAWTGERFFGLSSRRTLPELSKRTLRALANEHQHKDAVQASQDRSATPVETVLFLSDAFTENFFPQVGMAAINVLQLAGCRVIQLPVIGAGRTLISKGFLKAARLHANKLLAAIKVADPDGQMCIVGVEPSETFSLMDEYPDLFPGDSMVESIAKRTFNIEEFLVRQVGSNRESPSEGVSSTTRIMRIVIFLQHKQLKTQFTPNNTTQVLLHGHCYQKARPLSADSYPIGVEATVA
jgi:Fe-S oxidoreductase